MTTASRGGRRQRSGAGVAIAGMLIAAGAALLGIDPAAAQRAVPQSRDQVVLSYAPVVARAAPAVVNVFSRRARPQGRRGLFDDPFFRRFFGDKFPGGPSRRPAEPSLGSGVIVRPDGLIVTNFHVIEDADKIRVVLADRREFDATAVLRDKKTDLAVLRIDAEGEALPSLPLADSDTVAVGDLVLAIGNPFGVGQTVTSGIVSGLARTTVGISDFNFFIQTDAAINPGNSGGALVGMDGRLIGVNTAIYSRDGGSSGIGFAVPTNMVRTVIDAAETGGRVRRPWIGVSTQPVTQDIASSLGLRRPTGVLIKALHPDGPAAVAGLRSGDVVLSVNDRAVDDPEAMRFRLATEQIGRRVPLQLLRNGRTEIVSVLLIAPPEDPPRNLTELRGRNPLAGSRVGNLSPAFAEELGVDSSLTGVIVTGVSRRGMAARLGLRPGDILLSINSRSVGRVRDLNAILSDAPARTWEIEVQRAGRTVSFRARM